MIPVGTRVKSRVAFYGVPEGTEGIVDEHYRLCGRPGLTVAWDLPDRPLPADYSGYDGRPAFAPGMPLRDGFSLKELHFLHVLDGSDTNGQNEAC